MTAQGILDLLNEMYRLDPGAVHQLVMNHTTCNQALAEHPSIEVGKRETTDGRVYYSVGLLGVLNGIARVDGKTICAVFDSVPPDTREWGKFKGFEFFDLPNEDKRT